jgi:uncharacterized peroxidase-related enzyme
MPRINPIDPATAVGDSATALATMARAFGGRAPNMFTTAAQSSAAVGAMVSFFGYMGKASLGPKAGEQIALAVAQANGCSYCLSAHTAIGALHGLSPDEMTAARDAESDDPKIRALLELAVAVNTARGHIDDETFAVARDAGLTDAEIVEVVAHVALNVFTNYLNTVAQTTIDFPEVEVASAVSGD